MDPFDIIRLFLAFLLQIVCLVRADWHFLSTFREKATIQTFFFKKKKKKKWIFNRDLRITHTHPIFGLDWEITRTLLKIKN